MSVSQQRIVVGVDGSEHSKAALRWAIGQARLTGASVDAMTAWRYPATYSLATIVPDIDMEEEARHMLSQALAEVVGDSPTGGPGVSPGKNCAEVQVQQLVSEGPPQGVLLRAARDADLLVVGSRGQGGFASAILGSVSLACVLNAPCPVLVFREEEDRAGDG
ncbi:MAG: universal stress protein [Nocardiopsaceae bacterium]|nr:universal stress protein [Nocardiopsaceae bacterium]